MIVGAALSGVYKVPYTGAAGTTERLTWHAAGNQLDSVDAPDSQRGEEFRRVRQVAAPSQPREIRVVGPDSPFIRVGANQDVEPCALEAERQAAGSAEQVDRSWPATGAEDEPSKTRGVKDVWGSRMDAWP
jgi:hypothetical protein